MAKYDVTYSCGHSAVIQLFGPERDRQRRLEWYRNNGVCADCRAAERRRQYEGQSKAAAEANAAAGLPDLQGSEKQIAWAEALRAPVVTALRALATEKFFSNLGEPVEVSPGMSRQYCLPRRPSRQARQECADALALLTDETINQVSAKWWIDNRALSGSPATIRDKADALRWVLGQIKRRGLAPTALAEHQAEERAAAEAEDARKAALRAEDEARRERDARAEAKAAAALEALGTIQEVETTGAEGARITVRCVNGTAVGWIMDGEWCVCIVGDDMEVRSSHPMAQDVASKARQFWEARRNG